MLRQRGVEGVRLTMAIFSSERVWHGRPRNGGIFLTTVASGTAPSGVTSAGWRSESTTRSWRGGRFHAPKLVVQSNLNGTGNSISRCLGLPSRTCCRAVAQKRPNSAAMSVIHLLLGRSRNLPFASLVVQLDLPGLSSLTATATRPMVNRGHISTSASSSSSAKPSASSPSRIARWRREGLSKVSKRGSA